MTKEEKKIYMIEYRKTEKWKESKKKSDKKYYQKNKKSVQERNKTWKENNLEKFYSTNKKWTQDNPEKVKEIQKQYRNNNPHYKIRNLFHNLKKRNLTFSSINFQIIKTHIESQFTFEMNWGNTEIDHKIPISWFIPETPVDIINDLENLQPMLKEENRKKAASFHSPISNEYFFKISLYLKKNRIKQIKEALSL